MLEKDIQFVIDAESEELKKLSHYLDYRSVETLIEKIAQPYDISKTTINSVEV